MATRPMPPDWQKRRKAVLEAAGYRCQIASAFCTGDATQVDHKVRRADGGTDEPANLRASCAACNYARERKTNRKPSRRWQR